jgi:hypothetical protein
MYNMIYRVEAIACFRKMNMNRLNSVSNCKWIHLYPSDLLGLRTDTFKNEEYENEVS